MKSAITDETPIVATLSFGAIRFGKSPRSIVGSGIPLKRRQILHIEEVNVILVGNRVECVGGLPADVHKGVDLASFFSRSMASSWSRSSGSIEISLA